MLFVAAATASASSGGWVLVQTAVWKKHAGADPSPSKPNYGIVTTSSGAGTYTSGTYGEADLNLPALPTTDPNQIKALSYDFNPEQGGPSGGSPRLVVCFSDSPDPTTCGSNGELGPFQWTTPGSWSHVDGLAPSDGMNNFWVNRGGSASCASVSTTTWNGIVACHPNATITQVRVVNDSGWEFPANSYEQVRLDNLTVNTAVANGP
jgi:hypothetical protein